jgi:DNA-binding transcriptional MerR regulator
VSAVAAALAEKSPEAFRTISEVAAELDVPQHVLRFWESRFAQIRPVKRAGSRRYYRPDDVDLLRGIRALLYSDGYTIKGVQKILREQGIRYVADVGRQGPRAPGRRTAAVGDESRQAREGNARMPKAHEHVPANSGTGEIDKAERAKLTALLKELTKMKAQLRAARERH